MTRSTGGKEEFHKEPCAGHSLGLLHEVSEVFFDRLLSYAKGLGDLFVGPAFHQMLDDALLARGQLKPLHHETTGHSILVMTFLHNDQNAGLLSSPVGKPESA